MQLLRLLRELVPFLPPLPPTPVAETLDKNAVPLIPVFQETKGTVKVFCQEHDSTLYALEAEKKLRVRLKKDDRFRQLDVTAPVLQICFFQAMKGFLLVLDLIRQKNLFFLDQEMKNGVRPCSLRSSVAIPPYHIKKCLLIAFENMVLLETDAETLCARPLGAGTFEPLLIIDTVERFVLRDRIFFRVGHDMLGARKKADATWITWPAKPHSWTVVHAPTVSHFAALGHDRMLMAQLVLEKIQQKSMPCLDLSVAHVNQTTVDFNHVSLYRRFFVSGLSAEARLLFLSRVPPSSFLFVTVFDSCLVVWDVQAKCILELETRHLNKNKITSVEMQPDGTLLFLSDFKACWKYMFKPRTAWISSGDLRVLHDNGHCILCTHQAVPNKVVIWSVRTRQKVRTWELDSAVLQISSFFGDKDKGFVYLVTEAESRGKFSNVWMFDASLSFRAKDLNFLQHEKTIVTGLMSSANHEVLFAQVQGEELFRVSYHLGLLTLTKSAYNSLEPVSEDYLLSRENGLVLRTHKEHILTPVLEPFDLTGINMACDGMFVYFLGIVPDAETTTTWIFAEHLREGSHIQKPAAREYSIKAPIPFVDSNVRQFRVLCVMARKAWLLTVYHRHLDIWRLDLTTTHAVRVFSDEAKHGISLEHWSHTTNYLRYLKDGSYWTHRLESADADDTEQEEEQSGAEEEIDSEEEEEDELIFQEG